MAATGLVRYAATVISSGHRAHLPSPGQGIPLCRTLCAATRWDTRVHCSRIPWEVVSHNPRLDPASAGGVDGVKRFIGILTYVTLCGGDDALGGAIVSDDNRADLISAKGHSIESATKPPLCGLVNTRLRNRTVLGRATLSTCSISAGPARLVGISLGAVSSAANSLGEARVWVLVGLMPGIRLVEQADTYRKREDARSGRATVGVRRCDPVHMNLLSCGHAVSRPAVGVLLDPYRHEPAAAGRFMG